MGSKKGLRLLIAQEVLIRALPESLANINYPEGLKKVKTGTKRKITPLKESKGIPRAQMHRIKSEEVFKYHPAAQKCSGRLRRMWTKKRLKPSMLWSSIWGHKGTLIREAIA